VIARGVLVSVAHVAPALHLVKVEGDYWAISVTTLMTEARVESGLLAGVKVVEHAPFGVMGLGNGGVDGCGVDSGVESTVGVGGENRPPLGRLLQWEPASFQ
jgi:hypothetical protein